MEQEKIEKSKYIRIGTQIYRKETNPSGQEQLLPWTPAAIYQDYGKDEGNEILRKMPKYVGWVNEPSHTDYQPVIAKWLNMYQPLPFQPKSGVDFPHIKGFIRHIFQDNYEIGLDYLQLLYLQPKQKLPIIILVSRERNTGKTTFLNFLRAIFGSNATFNSNEDFKSQFNSDWANKLLVMVNEAFLAERAEYTERLKSLSTAKKYKAEAKGKDRIEVDFHAKFILCSNNIERPVIIEPGETRFWVIEVPRLESDDTQLLDKMIYEIPAFLDYLHHRQLTTEKQSRMWFSFDMYHTKALDRIIAANRNRLEQQMAYLLSDLMENCSINSLDICVKDIYNLLVFRGYRGSDLEERNIKKILQNSWELTPVSNGLTYTKYVVGSNLGGEYTAVKAVGRYYTIDINKVKIFT